MASPTAAGNFLSAATADEAHNDPFVSPAPSSGSTHVRYSDFDSQVFALGPSASPAQARRALEAHLAETDRRMEEAGKLGTALLQQRQELEDRLDEINKLQAQGEISDDLRQKLAEIERDYNEVAKESARAFLPKQRVPSNEVAAAAAGSPFTLEKGGRRSISPSKFETQATGSPTKFSVPNRKVRNQPATRIHDIEFAAEISTSLLAQVRNLQALLAEKDEELKDIKVERSKLEYEAEGLQQRIRALDESESRYKDENWSLEGQVQQLLVKEREGSDREKKLTQTLNIVQAEKNAAQRELDEVKLNHSRLTEEHAAAVKHHDIELGTAKRTMVMAESERAAMQRKIDDLTGQNQELAKVVSASQRAKVMERESIFSMSDEDFHTAHDRSTPEGSPPPSPVKLTPRHSMLETETLKTSLSHAQRTIQSLRSNLHREKTEKLEQRRLLQEARDELEKIRSDPAPVPTRRPKKNETKSELTRDFKKPPRLLGGMRSTRSEVFMEDPNWEDEPETSHHHHHHHIQSSPSRQPRTAETIAEQPEDFETAQETSDAAFETANEPNTETDDFHTGAEEFSSDDVDTETDSPTKHTLRGRPPSLPASSSMRRGSFHSTASTDDEDYPFQSGARTPPSLPPLHHKFPLRVSRGASFRRTRQTSEEPAIPSSPPSILSSSIMGTPKQQSQSLAAELGDFDGSDNDSNLSATPSRRSIRARTTTPPPVPPLPRVIMVDSSTMTEPVSGLPSTSTASAVGTERPMSMETMASRFSMSSFSDAGAQDMEDKLAKFPSPPTSPPKKDTELAMSTVHSHAVEPLPEPDVHAAEVAALRSEHAEHVKQMSAENTAAQAAAIEALKVQHADQLSQSQASAHLAHAQELEALRSSHADATNKAAAEAEAVRAQELETLKSSHEDQINKITAEIQARHVQELDDLRTAHDEKLVQKESEVKAGHAAEVAFLIATHAEQMTKQESESKAAYARDLEALECKHADEMSTSKTDSDAAHAAEITALEATYASQIEGATKELKDAHAKELDNLKAVHAEQIQRTKDESNAAHAEELETLKTSHLRQIEEVKNGINATHSQEMDSLKATHAKQLDELQKGSDAAHAAEIAALKASHDDQLEALKVENDATLSREITALKDAHAKEIELLNSQHAATHASEVAILVASHEKKLDSHKAESATALSRELTTLKDTHAREMEALNMEHSAAHSQELEGFKAALAKQIESSKSEGNVAHAANIEALNAAHAEILEAHRRDSEKSQTHAVESLKSMHERQIEALNTEHCAAKSKALEDLSTNHLKELDALRAENESCKAKMLAELSSTHAQALDNLRRENESSKNQEVMALRVSHEKDLEALKSGHEASQKQKLQELAEAHTQELDRMREESKAAKAKELAALGATHTKNLDDFKAEHEATQARQLKELADAHSRELEGLRQESEGAKSMELATLSAGHEKDLASLKKEHEGIRLREIDELKDAHATALASLRTEHRSALDNALQTLKAEHAAALDTLKKESQLSQTQALDSLKASHSQQLEQVKGDSDAALARELDAMKIEHASILESQKQESSAEMDRLLASHTSELEALRKSLAVPDPALSLSQINSVVTEPVEVPEPRSPKREAFILPREEREPHTPLSAIVGGIGKKGKDTATPIIAEDDTRQSPNASGGPETPESQRPFKEMSTNTDTRPARKPPVETSNQGSQTTLTSDGLEHLMKTQRPTSQDSRSEMAGIPFSGTSSSVGPAIRVRSSSQESLGASRASQKMGDSGPVSAPEPVPSRRPGSSASARGSLQNRPPLPPNHREAIEAARTHSSGGGKGTMGPPMLPASAYRTPASQPHTPAPRRPQSPASGKGTPTPRAARTPGYGEFQSPTMRMRPRSRQSSVSSFASEIDTRFNIRPEMGIEGAGFGLGTDPRMIQAITQTMIGEYLWKYTRKAGRGEMSENRHRRYFWVHPYTRTLYWSDRDPSTAGRAELKAKSVPIEAVRVVADDNPMPPGLHRKSLVIVSPGRSIKFTCTTGQRHETWFNALSYLLLRTGTECQTDAEEIAGNITQDDVDEFNPPFGRRTAEGHRSRAPPSLSSYNSRTTRNESPNVDLTIPTLTPTHEKEGPRGSGTLGRLSGYWKSSTSTLGGTLTSLRARSHNPHDTAIYEASEVHDSAEDLRQIMEQQDREADRLENVRACCDGKHDVGTLSHTAKRSLLSNLHSHSHTHTHPGPSSSPTPMGNSSRSRI